MIPETPPCWSCIHYRPGRDGRPDQSAPFCWLKRLGFPRVSILCPAYDYEPGSDAQVHTEEAATVTTDPPLWRVFSPQASDALLLADARICAEAAEWGWEQVAPLVEDERRWEERPCPSGS